MDHTIIPKLIIEFVGTFFLVLTASSPGGAIAVGLILMTLIFLGGHISGAHYNPAVTLAVLLSRRQKITLPEAAGYWVVQFIAGFSAGLLGVWLFGASSLGTEKSLEEAGKVLTVEFLFTFALASVVLNVATTQDNDGNSFYGAAIGLTVGAGALAVGHISGGVFNPAVATGLIFSSGISGKPIVSIWLYYLADLSGGVLAALIFRLTNPKEYGDYSEFVINR